MKFFWKVSIRYLPQLGLSLEVRMCVMLEGSICCPCIPGNAALLYRRQLRLRGAFGIGTLSALVASPCTTAPLAGVLMYVVLSGDALNGFITLYTLSLGMGIRQ